MLDAKYIEVTHNATNVPRFRVGVNLGFRIHIIPVNTLQRDADKPTEMEANTSVISIEVACKFVVASVFCMRGRRVIGRYMGTITSEFISHKC